MKTWKIEIVLACLSVVGLIGVAVTKTLWTKAMFSALEFHFPITTCAISCAVTIVALAPVFLCIDLKPVPKGQYGNFTTIAVLTALDLACMNLGLDALDVSVQQALNAATPAAVIMFELLFFRKVRSTWVYLPFIPLIAGSVLTTLASGSHESSPSGVFFMICAIFSGALKAITTHNFLTKMKNEMGVLSFLFWLDIAMLSLLIPGAYLFEEFRGIAHWPRALEIFAWAVVISNGLFGGVRAWLVKVVLKYNTALTKVVCDIIIKAATIGLSVVIFQNTLTTWMLVGIILTMGGFSLYTTAAFYEKMSLRNCVDSPVVKKGKRSCSRKSEPACMVAQAVPERRRISDGDVEEQPLLDSPQHASRA
uniref:Sugar phosphate transporter domain-containing protein n=1 Tax=Lotharella oceanica TaxID=641309 RepID=A0A7S2U3Z9_9EUKA